MILRRSGKVLFLVMLVFVFAGHGFAQGADDLVQKALNDSTFHWDSMVSMDAVIYYQPGSFAEKHRAMLLRSAAKTIDEVLAYLDESEYDFPLTVFYLDSRQEMERIIGHPVTGFANWSANGIFVVCNPEWRSFEKHEFTHIITMGTWGSPHDTSRWMVEGIAIACDRWCREYSVDEIAYHYLSNDELPPLPELFDDIRSLGEIRGGFYAGSVIGFIRETYGVEALRSLWLNGVDHFTGLVGINLDQLEASWKDYLKKEVSPNIQVDIETIGKRGCG